LTRAAGDVDAATGAVLIAHLSVYADGEPQRTDQVHLDGERMKQHGPLEVVVGAGRALDARHQRGNVLGVRGGDCPAGIVDQDVDSAVTLDHRVNHRVDRTVIALIAHHLVGTFSPPRLGVHAGNGVQR
jgi:hypothetical protein